MDTSVEFTPEILIVEDDPAIRETLDELLMIEGYRTICAGHGKEALELLGRGGRLPRLPKLILLDLMMPVMTGWEFLAARRERPDLSGIPVVVITAAGDGFRGLATEGEVLKVLRKPIHFDELLGVLASKLRQRSA